MRHRKAGLKLNRTSSHRNAMFRNMVTSLFKYDRIQTTDAKAKELKRWADHLITLAKRGDLHARRQVLSIVREKNVVHKLFEEAASRYGDVSGGYTKSVKIGRRHGDAAPMTIVELIAFDKSHRPRKKPKKKESTEVTEKASEEKETAPVHPDLKIDPKSDEQISDEPAEKEAKAKEQTSEKAPDPPASDQEKVADQEAEASAVKEESDEIKDTMEDTHSAGEQDDAPKDAGKKD